MRKVLIDRSVYVADDTARTYRFQGRNRDWEKLTAKKKFLNKRSVMGYSRILRSGKRVKFLFSKENGKWIK